ncbi:ROK family protein [Nocardioides sp. GY 10113]|uniref:ROK family transcriptional regulator n=1 Tax=Nocardioides sp. GY 10113 TaxID=2569761 RepID=UPI0010A7D968|nr:ROK family transcriptional regulator [Nocardioides sp. GY 10113]TIC86278.1 ROK family protein [Nocardioides sp. GY 10113]
MSANTRGAGTNQEGVRRHNLGTLLRHVHRSGELSRAELTSLMGLNRSTIAGLVGELESNGLLEQSTAAASRRTAGRPSAAVRLAGHGPYVVAVDLGVDRAVAARVGLGGHVFERAEATIVPGSEAWQVGAAVAGLIRHVVSLAPAGTVLLGVGVAVPGMVRRGDGLIRQAPNLGWRDVSFGSILLAALGVDVPVFLGNDGDLGAFAEHRRGVGVGVDDLIYISGNVGVGAGVIAGGMRIQGAGGYAGEIGHLAFDPNGEPCHCGSRGCWETVVGAHAIADALGSPQEQVIRLGEVLERYTSPPRDLRPIAANLGRGLAAVVNAFDPSMLILGGYFRPLFRLLRAEVSAGLRERALAPALESLRLTAPGLGADSVLMGAAELALEPVLTDPVASLAGGVPDARTRLAG